MFSIFLKIKILSLLLTIVEECLEDYKKPVDYMAGHISLDTILGYINSMTFVSIFYPTVACMNDLN